MNNLDKTIAKHILQTLMGQEFADWYNKGTFDDYITGELMDDGSQINEEQVLRDIIKLFRLSRQ